MASDPFAQAWESREWGIDGVVEEGCARRWFEKGMRAGMEAAADRISKLNDKAGDRASYDNREMYDGEMERMHALSDAEKEVRALMEKGS